jgi:hypothetical protein
MHSEITAALQAHVRGKLAPYEYPKEIEFIDALPMTTTGKVQRRVLRLQEEATGQEVRYSRRLQLRARLPRHQPPKQLGCLLRHRLWRQRGRCRRGCRRFWRQRIHQFQRQWWGQQ